MLDYIDPQADEVATEAVTNSKQSPATFKAVKEQGDNGNPVLTCVFDKNCNHLFKAINKKQWSEVAYFIDHNEWPSFALNPDFPPKEQALTVVSGYDEEADETWTYLALHLAIVRGAPLPLIDRLVDIAPEALKIPDHEGNLALHLAFCVNARYNVQNYLIGQYSVALKQKNMAGLTPIQLALTSTNKGAVVRGKIIHAFIKNATLPAKALDLKEIDLFCDFNSNCSPLFSKISNNEWESVLMFLRDGQWSEPSVMGAIYQFVTMKSEPDASSIPDQVKTLVTKCDDEGQLEWARLPIHLAIMLNAPFEVTKKLIEIFPESLAFPDSDGNLPLHLALANDAKDAVVGLLVASYPDAIRVRDGNDATAVQVALAGNEQRGRVIQYMIKAGEGTVTGRE